MNDECLAMMACTRNVPNEKPTHKQDCRDVINISVFFDGTGNNREADTPKKSWSNIARMYESALNIKSNLNHNIYIEGIGTKMDYPKRNALVAKMEDSKILGGALGAGADSRIDKATDKVEERVLAALAALTAPLEAKAKGEDSKNEAQGEGDIAKAIGKHRLLKVINFNLFGFSRGASLARAFANNLIKNCTKDEAGNLLYKRKGGDPVPMRIGFLGLFDTVASFGAPAKNLNANIKLGIPKEVEQCVHFAAAHELRWSFPLELANGDNVLQKIYPGVHSDVGGGYEPKGGGDAQGIDNNAARIPMKDMMREAVVKGVPMLSYANLANDEKLKAIFDEQFKILPDTQNAYDTYMAAAGAGGAVPDAVNAHVKALYSVVGTLKREGKLGEVGLRYKDMAEQMAMYEDSAEKAKRPAHDHTQTIDQLALLEPWRVEAWRQTASPAQLAFLSHYVHNSKLDVSEPTSYFKPRALHVMS
jgi:Uncharacterized alpha/beta hydrolase domain (DUF2235)